MRKFPALGGAFAFALAGALIAAPAFAKTHHPSTPQEKAQTRDLNIQQLQQAQAPANQQAMNTQGQAAPAQDQKQKQAAPTDQKNGQAAPSSSEQTPAPNAPGASTSGTQSPPKSSDTSTPQSQQPAPSGY